MVAHLRRTSVAAQKIQDYPRRYDTNQKNPARAERDYQYRFKNEFYRKLDRDNLVVIDMKRVLCKLYLASD